MNTHINDKYWMGIVDQIATASTCRVKLGTILIKDKVMVGVGYTGSVSGDSHCENTNCLLLPNHGIQGSGDNLASCYRTVHAEMNAVLKCNARGSKEAGWLECYSSYSPCLSCFKVLLQIGVRKFVFKYHYKDLYRDAYIQELSFNAQFYQLENK